MNEWMNGKPEGVKGANICRKAAGEDKFQIIAFSSSPYYDSITGPAKDYTYMVRYRGMNETDLSNESSDETVAARGYAGGVDFRGISHEKAVTTI